jgi:F-type H+-transporting ATPase subunit delta
MASEIAGRYAEALFQLSMETDTLEERKQEAAILLDELKNSPDLSVFFRAVQIPASDKKAEIDRMFAPFLPDTRNFLKLLIDKDRTYYLKPILKTFIGLANQELGIEEATVASARPLSNEQMDRIREALEKKTGHKVWLVNTIDKSLIAGIKVTTGNTVTDVSVARQMQGMKEALLKGGRA